MPTARDIFISHSSGDAEVARALRTLLEDAGYSCWMAPDDIVGTETWTEQILGAIADSKAMIVLISSASNRSSHVSREVNLAIGKNRAVLPIRIESVAPSGSLEYLLSLVQRFDAFPPPITDFKDRLLRRVASIVQASPSDEPAETPTDPAPNRAGPARRTPKPRTPKPPAAKQPKAPTPAHIGVGSVVGGFTLESVLGEGGMATVFRARQTEPNRLVALKVIRADHAADETYRKRFLAEKETLAALEHPSIVPIYAAGAADGVLYIAMRLVAGPDLQARIAAESRLSLRETVEILQPIADAVDYAHAAGIIHRDLKPSNIILDSAARPYLTDFGLGKRVEVETDLSAPGLTIGTLDYMAPEQFDGAGGAKPGPEIDIYALGCVAYQCLTGKAPFVRDTPQQLMYAHVHEAPPAVRSVRPEYPPELDTVFAKVLAKDPAARFASATEFVEALDGVVTTAAASQTRPLVIAPQGSSERVRRWLGANTALAVGGGAVAVVLAVILGAALVFKPPAPSPGPTQVAAATTKPGPTPGPTVALPLTASEEALRSRLPILAIDITKCTSWPTPPNGPDVLSPSGYAASTARITCPGPAGSNSGVQYAMYQTKTDLGDDYKAIMKDLGVTQGGACKSAIPANAPWQHGSTGEAGVLACFERNGRVQYVWTDYERRTLAQWLAPDNAAGFAFWQSWTEGFNPGEQALLDALPASVDGAGNCVRADDLYWASALAAVSCPRAAGGNPVFYGGFAAADAFPNDPMTTQFASLMNTYGHFAEDTKTGCLDKDASGASAPTYGRYTWVYPNGATEGYIGCYARTDTNPATSQLIWTFNRTAVMGLWTAPDLPSAVTLFNDWTAAVR